MTTAPTITRPMTADELLAMPDDGFRYELVRGELIKMSPASPFHSECAMLIGASLVARAEADGLGKVYGADAGFLLASDHVRAPDAAFVRAERAKEVSRGTTGFFPGPPDLAVEVISPSDRLTEVNAKVAEWLAAGTLAVVVVNPRNLTVRIHRSQTDVVILNADDVLEVQDIVPGWRMAVANIFRLGARQ